MWRLVSFLGGILALAIGLSWLADRPGNLTIDWQGYVVETSVFRAIVLLGFLIGLAILTAAIVRHVWRSPATIGNFFNRRRQQRGLDALSSGMIAIGAGDRSLATRYALQARKSLPNEPLTHLLRAQAAQLSGDQGTARRIFEAMLGSPDTEQLGLRGLFLEADNEGETEAARQFAERAVALNPKLGWPLDALFDIQCRQADWPGALDTLAVGRKHSHFDKGTADRRRAVLLTAQAQALEDSDPVRAMNLAREAHGLAQDLVPAAAIAGRLLSARANTPKAIRVLQRTWKRSPHPDLAVAYAYARHGDSPRDRLDRVKQLADLVPNSAESAIAVATAAIEAREWAIARKALEPMLESRLSQRVCTLMARIEGEEHGDTGRVREWLARAVNAPRDPAWTADGVVSDRWAPASPVTGALDAFEWRVPVEAMEKADEAMIASKLEELVALGTRPDRALPSSKPGDGKGDDKPPASTAGGPPPRKPIARAADDAEVVTVPAARPGGDGGSGKSRPAPRPASEPRPAAVGSPEPAARPQASVPAQPAAPANGPAAAARAGAQRSQAQSAGGKEPRIYVPPRAPDDPGLESADGIEDRRSPLLPARAPVKGRA